MNRAGIKDKVLYNVASQTLAFEAPQGRPSANGTVTLYDPRYDRDDSAATIVTGTATRSSATGVLSGAAGPTQTDPRAIPMTTDLTSYVEPGDFLWLTNAYSQTERIEVAKISATSITAADVLGYTYAAADTIASAVMTSPAVPTAWIEDSANIAEDFYAEWVYAFGGVTYRTRSRFDVVREIVDLTVFDSDLLELIPDLARWRFKSSPASYAPVIRGAAKEVEALLIGLGLDPDKCRGNEILRQCTKWSAIYNLAMNGACPPGVAQADHYAHAKERYEFWTTSLLRGALKVPYDESESDIVTDAQRGIAPISLRRV